MKQIIDGIRYDTEKATKVAGDDHWDGHNSTRVCRNTFLYKTAKGRFFAFYATMWQGELDRIVPLNEAAAKSLYETLTTPLFEYEEIFGQTPEEA